MRSKFISCLIVTCLIQLEAQLSPERLDIVIVEGEGAVNNIGQPAARDLAVRVEDENKKPVAGAAVTFTLPAQGAGGTFINQTGQATAMSDAKGLAMIRGLRPNKLAGKVEILVVASYKGQTARATVTQFNMLVRNAPKKSGSGKVILILSLVGAAAAGGAYAGTHKSGTTATPAPPAPAVIGITPGTGTVGAPQ